MLTQGRPVHLAPKALELKRLRHESSDFRGPKGLVSSIQPDGRLHPFLNLTGTRTFLVNLSKPVNAGTLRQQMEAHRRNPACANCHAKMDPLGFGLENFDAVGAFRDKDDGQKIDPSGELPGGVKFAGPAELKTILMGKKAQFARCLAEKLLTYSLGRGLEFYDKRSLDRITAGLAKADYKFSALVTEVVTSDPFRLRRGTTGQ